MPVFLIIGCETIVFSLLIGAFMNSLGMGLVVLGGTALIMYMLFQRSYNSYVLIWGATLLWSFTILLWGSYIDRWLDTTYIAVILSLLGGRLCYYFNKYISKNYQE